MKKYWLLIVLYAVSSSLVAGEVVLWNGGMSIEDRAAAPQKGTRLAFFNEQGSFIADVQVLVKDADGTELVNTMTLGPWLILALPNGRCTVLATLADGAAQGGYIEVDGSNKEFGYMFRSK